MPSILSRSNNTVSNRTCHWLRNMTLRRIDIRLIWQSILSQRLSLETIKSNHYQKCFQMVVLAVVSSFCRAVPARRWRAFSQHLTSRSRHSCSVTLMSVLSSGANSFVNGLRFRNCLFDTRVRRHETLCLMVPKRRASSWVHTLKYRSQARKESALKARNSLTKFARSTGVSSF